MLIYILTISLLFIFSILEFYFKLNIKLKNILIGITFFIIVLQYAFRWETGTDWSSYLEHFIAVTNLNSFKNLDNLFEPGYNILVYIFKLFSASYSGFLLLHSLIYFSIMFSSIREYSNNPLLTLTIFYTSTIGIMGSNRQLLALSICLYGLRYIFTQKKKFYIFVGLACFFHITALLFILYLFFNKEINIKYIVLLIFAAIIIGKTEIPINVFSVLTSYFTGITSDKSKFYLSELNSLDKDVSLSILGLIKRLALLALFYINRKKMRQINSYFNLFFNSYVFSLIIYFLFSSSLMILINRGSIYFNFSEIFLLSIFLFSVTSPIIRNIAFIFILFLSGTFFYISINPFKEYFIPYKGIFYNTDFKRYNI